MCGSKSLWHEALYRNPQQFCARVSENSFNLQIHVRDSPVSIGYDDRVGRKFKEIFEQRLGGSYVPR
jgi:hypothetical protein